MSRLLSHGAPHQTALTGPFGISKGWNLLALFSSALPPAAWGSESLTRGRSEVGTGLGGGAQRPRGHPLPRSLGLITLPEVRWAESTALVGSGGVWGHVVTYQEQGVLQISSHLHLACQHPDLISCLQFDKPSVSQGVRAEHTAVELGRLGRGGLYHPRVKDLLSLPSGLRGS